MCSPAISNHLLEGGNLDAPLNAVDELELPNFDAAIEWIEDNQLGRRNLTDDQFSYLIGRQFERAKRQGARTDLTFRQNGGKLRTAEAIAAEHGIAPRAVERAADFARDVDAIANKVGDSTRSELLSGHLGATRADVKEMAEAIADKPHRMFFGSAKDASACVKE
jgi:hypothetical protein